MLISVCYFLSLLKIHLACSVRNSMALITVWR